MIGYSSHKRSPAMSQAEARKIAAKPDLFGYVPMVVGPLNGDWYLSIRGDGADDKVIKSELESLRGN